MDTAVVPTHFTLSVWPPEPAGAVLLVSCSVVDGEVTIPAVAGGRGLDAVQGLDQLRKIMPIKEWIRLAIVYLSVELLVQQVRDAGDPELVSELMGVDRTEAQRMLSAATPGPETPDPAWIDAWAALHMELSGGAFPTPPRVPIRRPRRRNSVTDDHLREVADTYRRALAAGAPPTKEVAERMGASHSTAARWVKMARDKGFLGATSPGRSGELTTDDTSND